MQQAKIEAILWDLDGTLVLTEDMMPEVNALAVRSMGYIATDEDTKRWHGMSDYQIWQDALAKASNPISFEDYKNEYLKAFDRFKHLVVPRPGAVELVQFFHDFKVPQAVVTSALRVQADISLARFQGSDKFLFSITADDVPEGRTKPDPYPYASAFLRLRDNFNIKTASCLVMEDSHSGVASGIAAGMTVLHWLRDENEKPSPLATIVVAKESEGASKLMPVFFHGRLPKGKGQRQPQAQRFTL